MIRKYPEYVLNVYISVFGEFFYNKYKDITIVEKLLKELKPKNFRVSLFPRKVCNKNQKNA